jgi:hypothetical protein
MSILLTDLLEVLSIPLKGVLLLIIGLTALFFGRIELKDSRRLWAAVLILIAILSMGLGIALLVSLLKV